MSQEGASLPREVEGSHDQATAPHGSIPAGVGSPAATVMPAGSNPSSVDKLASAVNNAGSFERASPAVLSAGEDNNVASAKITSPAVLQASEDRNAASSNITIPAVLHAGEDNNAAPKIASPAVLLAGEEKGNSAAGSKLASPATMLHDCDDNKAGSHAGVDNDAARSMLASPAVLHAGDGNNGGSKIFSPPVPQAIVDNTTGFKLNSPVALHAGKHNNAGFKVPNPVVLHSSKDTAEDAARSKLASPAVPQAIVDNTTGSKLNSPTALHAGFKVPNPVVLHASRDTDNNAGRPKFASPVLLPNTAQDNRARTKLAIQSVSHAGGNAGSSRLTRSAAAALHAAKENASKLDIQAVPPPHLAGKDNNAGSSNAARPAAVDAGESNAKAGKNSVAGEQRANEAADVGIGSGKGSAAIAAFDADHELHIFTERERRKKMKNMFSTLHGLLPQLPDKADKATIVGETVIYIRALESTLQKLQKLKMERSRAPPPPQQLAVGAGASSSRAATARRPAPPPPAPASREANLADMVHSLQAQQAAAVAAANKALMTGAAAAGSSSSAPPQQLPRGAVPFPAPPAGFQTWSGQNAVVSVANNEAYINLHCPREPGTLTKALFVLERHSIEVVTTTVSTTQDGFRMYGIHARATPASASARFPETVCAEDRFKLAVSEMVQMINI